MKKTLGGDRLGAGKKMQVELHNYGRSTHDMGYIWRSTMSAGTLVPFMSKIGLPGDTFDIDLDCDVKTHPTLGPLFGSYKVQLDVFEIPIRLYNAQLHNNKLGIGMNMANVTLPTMTWPAISLDDYNLGVEEPGDIDNSQINPSSIMAYLGLRGIGQFSDAVTDGYRKFNAVPWLGFWDIYKNYYANKQEEIGMVIHTDYVTPIQHVNDMEGDPGGAVLQPYPGGALFAIDNTVKLVINLSTAVQPINQLIVRRYNGGLPETNINLASVTMPFSESPTEIVLTWTGGPMQLWDWRYATAADINQEEIGLAEFPLSDIDKMREDILAAQSTPVDITDLNYLPWSLAQQIDTQWRAINSSQEGLAIKTYQSDLFNNWLSTEWIDGPGGISEITAVDTSGGSFTIDTLNLSKKVYDMLNRIAVSGGSYDDWLDAVYTNERYTRAESPMYMGGLIKELVFQEVVSNNAQATGEGDPLGTLAGKGVMAKKHKGGSVTIKVQEPSYIMGIVSLTPRIDYSQGNEWDLNLRTMDDLHKPALDEIGFQELITEQMAWWDTIQTGFDTWVQKSAGKQPAWMNYMTSTNKVLGNFAIQDNEMFMTLNRRYQAQSITPGGYWTIGDLTTYVDPAKFNFIFADTALDSQNFWVQISVDITARRKISARLMPNL